MGLIPGLGKIPWRRKRQPTPVLLPGKSRGQRMLEGYSPWGRKELDTTERLSTAQHTLRSEEERRTGKKRQGTEFLLIRGVKALFHSTLSWLLPAKASLEGSCSKNRRVLTSLPLSSSNFRCPLWGWAHLWLLFLGKQTGTWGEWRDISRPRAQWTPQCPASNTGVCNRVTWCWFVRKFSSH